MDALKSLSEESIEVLIDNLCDCQKEIDSNVVIAREFIAPLLGPQDVIVLNSHHAASSELYRKEPSKLRVALPISTWRGLGIGKSNTDIILPPQINWMNIMISVCNDIWVRWPAKPLCHILFKFHVHTKIDFEYSEEAEAPKPGTKTPKNQQVEINVARLYH